MNSNPNHQSRDDIAMKFFDLAPEDTWQRIQAAGKPITPPSALSSTLRGAVGFTILGVLGFLPWVLGWGRTLGEGGMYAACAVVFIGGSGPLLHRLILGPGSLSRFYRLFLVAFFAYAVIWSAFWFAMKTPGRDYLGLLMACSAFAAVVAGAFRAWPKFFRAAAALTLLHAAGYWIGAEIYAQQSGWVGAEWFGGPLTKRTAGTIARTLWGVGYGVGFGAGLGLMLHFCQTELRERLVAELVREAR